MQSKDEPLIKGITGEMVIEHITPNFKDCSTELKNLALLNKTFNSFFQSQYKIGLLLNYIAAGNQDAAKKILGKYPQLMTMRGSVIDPSGRHFKNISAFELCLWTLDVRYMGGMMIDCIPKDMEGDKIRKQLLDQYNKVKEQGVTYTFKKKEITESHFDFTPLLNALTLCIKNFSIWKKKERQKQCRTEIGNQQVNLPIHVKHHYCEVDEFNSNTTSLDKNQFKRNLKIYDLHTKKELIWTSELIGLGENFSIFRGGWQWVTKGRTKYSAAASKHLLIEDIKADLLTFTSLYKRRIEDLESLKKNLEQPILELEKIKESSQKFI